jgi:hypothetical protein
MLCATYTVDTSYSYVIHFHFTREYFMSNEISFCHNVNITNQLNAKNLILTKPEEFQIVIPAAFVTPSGIVDLNFNGGVMKSDSNHTS